MSSTRTHWDIYMSLLLTVYIFRIVSFLSISFHFCSIFCAERAKENPCHSRFFSSKTVRQCKKKEEMERQRQRQTDRFFFISLCVLISNDLVESYSFASIFELIVQPAEWFSVCSFIHFIFNSARYGEQSHSDRIQNTLNEPISYQFLLLLLLFVL